MDKVKGSLFHYMWTTEKFGEQNIGLLAKRSQDHIEAYFWGLSIYIFPYDSK